MRAAAAADPVPASCEPDAAGRLGRRYELAFKRLVNALGAEWIGHTKPKTRGQLEMIAEAAVDECCREGRGQAGASSSAPASRPAPRKAAEHEAADDGKMAKKPLEELRGETKILAVPTAVAATLNAEAGALGEVSEIASKDILKAIPEAPAHLRTTLQRVVLSNGKVDSMGELQLSKRTLPSDALALRAHIITSIEEAIREVPRQDADARVASDRREAVG